MTISTNKPASLFVVILLVNEARITSQKSFVANLRSSLLSIFRLLFFGSYALEISFFLCSFSFLPVSFFLGIEICFSQNLFLYGTAYRTFLSVFRDFSLKARTLPRFKCLRFTILTRIFRISANRTVPKHEPFYVILT
jgi:hypothetical protein